MSSLNRLLRTRRLALRPVVQDDLNVLLSLRNEPRVLAGSATGAELPAEQMARQLQRWLTIWRVRDVGTWMVELDGAIVGFVVLDPIGDGYTGVDPDALEIGVVVHPDHWGTGIAGEAGFAVATDCFTRAGLPHLYATVDQRNAQSLAVIEKVNGARRIDTKEGEDLYVLAAEA